MNGRFEAARKAVEKPWDNRLKCDDKSDKRLGCELVLRPKKAVFVMAEDRSSKSTLIGCDYFYEK